MRSASQQPRNSFAPLWIGLAAMLWAFLPIMVGTVMAPAGYTLVGTSALNPTDAVVYESYIEQGRTDLRLNSDSASGWWMHDWFTSEIMGPTLWQPHWWLLGRVAAWFSLTTPMAYWLLRLIGAAVLTGTVWWTVRWLFPQLRTQRLAAILVVFGGGLGWLWALLTQPHFLVTSAPDFWVAEMYPALSLLTSPHFLFITAGILATLVGVERSATERQPRYLLIAMLAGVMTAALHPFHLLTWIGIWLTLTIWRRSQGQSVAQYVRGWIAVVCVCAPIVLLYGIGLLTDELVRGRAVQNVAPTWPWALTIVALGIFGLAALRSRRGQWNNVEQWRWLVAWAVIGTLAVFLPLSFQRRLSHALVVPFILLGIPVLESWLDRVHDLKTRILVTGFGIVVLCASSLTSLVVAANGYWREVHVANQSNLYLSPEQRRMYTIIRQDPNPDEVVLGSVTSSQFVPAWARHRVFIGHSVETLQFQPKLQELRKLYASSTPAEQQDFLLRHRICWIIQGPRERAYGNAFQPDTWPTLQAVWRGSTTTLYRNLLCA